MKAGLLHHYKLGRQIGAGSFGQIFEATHLETGVKYAAKSESQSAKHPQLQLEDVVYRKLEHQEFLPKIHWRGKAGSCFVVVMDLLGDSLEDLFIKSRRKFSLKTITLIALQLIERLRFLHEHNYIHRDMKPDNFLIGLGNKSNILHVIDFGLSKLYRNGQTGKHIKCQSNKRLTGTPRYASINTHKGCEQSRRDDLESLGYMLVYFCKGSLPWQGMTAKTKQEKYEKISNKKQTIHLSELCKDIPKQFQDYLSYCRNLRFTDAPDYKYLKELFEKLFYERGFTNDKVFDWTKKLKKRNVKRVGTPISKSRRANLYSSPKVSCTTKYIPRSVIRAPVTRPPRKVRRVNGFHKKSSASATTVPRLSSTSSQKLLGDFLKDRQSKRKITYTRLSQNSDQKDVFEAPNKRQRRAKQQLEPIIVLDNLHEDQPDCEIEKQKLRKHNGKLKKENVKLKTDNSQLQKDNTQLQKENKCLKVDRDEWKAKVKSFERADEVYWKDDQRYKDGLESLQTMNSLLFPSA